jgi:hypothetical protein
MAGNSTAQEPSAAEEKPWLCGRKKRFSEEKEAKK